MSKEINVLVVDDEENILKSVNRLFLSAPFGIVTTTDIEEANQLLGREKIKVVLSDYRMPNITGVEFLKKIKVKYPDIVRILFTGYADIQAAEAAINEGEVFRFISKPWSTDDLKVTIRQAIQHFDLLLENKMLLEYTQTKNRELDVMNRKLQNMYEAQKEFSSMVSHELRTPLASVKTAIDVLLSGTQGDLNDVQQNFLDRTKGNVDRLNRLINDILDLSKLEFGKFSLNKQVYNIHQIIRESIESQQPVAQKKGLQLESDLADDIPQFALDIDRVNQVLSNLLSNAIKYTEKGGITVATQIDQDQKHVLVQVRDTGPGIPAGDRGHLFEKFQRLSQMNAQKTEGTGLGLAICREIVNQHGGRIWLDEEYQQGSCFIFSLPIKDNSDIEHIR